MSKYYSVKKIQDNIVLSGTGEDALWQQANALDDFCYPWEFSKDSNADATKPLVDNAMRFKALWNDEHFYFLFKVKDENINAKHEQLLNQPVIDCGRVELFFKSDDAMRPYYALEMDPLARLLEAKGNYYRDLDFDWRWPQNGLQIMSAIEDDGYSVEGVLSMAALRELDLYPHNGELQVGIYRAQYNVDETLQEDKAQWISWIVPDSVKPDFHIPSSFGLLRLLDD